MELETDTENPVVDPEVQEEIEQAGKKAAGKGKGSVTEDVLKKKGAYGRFTSRWFSKRGWAVDQRRVEGLSRDPPPQRDGTGLEDKPENQPAPPTSDGDVVDLSTDKGEDKKDDTGEDSTDRGQGKAPQDSMDGTVEDAAEAVKESVTHSLTPKLLHTTKLLLATSRSFYFSYTHDLTRSWDTQVSNYSDHPLFKIVDPNVSPVIQVRINT